MKKITLRSYPKRIEVLGADFGYVTDYRYMCTDPSFFKQILAFEKEQLKKNSTGKIAARTIEIKEKGDTTKLSLRLWETNGSFTYTFNQNSLHLVKRSGGGNLHNIMRNWDEILTVLNGNIENLPEINFRAVSDKDKTIFGPFEHLTFHHIKGDHRKAFIFMNPDTKEMVSFVIPRADLSKEHHILSEMPEEAAYFLVGNEPYTSQGHMEFLIDHLERYPESKIFYLPSTIQVNQGYKPIEFFLEKVYAFACNLTEAHILLGWDLNIIDPEESAERVADAFHAMGIKRVVISHGHHGMFCSIRHSSLHAECVNWDPIIDVEALLHTLPETITHLDTAKNIPIRGPHTLDVTGCGDAFTSGVFFYELLHLDEFTCHDISLAKYLAGLKSIYPFSNLKGINSEVLKHVMIAARFIEE